MKKHATVTEFLDDLDENKRLQVEELRGIILNAEPKLEEHIKWNSPSYIFRGEDRITFNLHNKENHVKLVFHMDATRTENRQAKPVMNDETGLMRWSSDIRGILAFSSLEEIDKNRDKVNHLIRAWIAVR